MNQELEYLNECLLAWISWRHKRDKLRSKMSTLYPIARQGVWNLLWRPGLREQFERAYTDNLSAMSRGR